MSNATVTTTDARTTDARVDILTDGVDRFLRAKDQFNNARIGSDAADRAERCMDRLVQRAERLGVLQAFVRSVTDTY